jgi:autotransporter-associated beta strand protein
MAYAVPERFQELLTRASELGNNRIFAGMHSPLDVMGGRVTATALAAAILSDPSNSSLKQAAYDDAHSKLLTQTGTAEDRFSNYDKNKDDYTQRLTYGFSPIHATTNPMVVPKGAEVLLETRLPYLDSTQRRWVLATTGLSSGYPLLDDQEGWGRLNLFAAADGYGAFATDVTVTMDSNKGGFNALDRWRNDISGPGKLTKEGTGTLKLQGSNAYSGGTQVDEGALEGNSESAFGSGDVTVNGGTLVDNVPGPMIIGGNYTQSAGGTLELDLSSKNDHLEMNGAVQANGKLRLNFLNNYVPADGVYTIISHGKGQRSGQFASVETVGLPSQYKVNIIYNADSIQLAVGYTGISLDSSNYDLSIGSSHNTVVSATYSDGTVVDVSQYATYSSSQPQIATVSSSGLVTAISSGTTVITATYENYSATSTIQAYKSSSGGSSTGENTSLPTPSPAAPQTTAKPDAPKAPIGTTAPSSSKIFSDVNEAYSWAAGAIDALASKGIIQGTSDKTFSPDKKITRADVVVLLVRALNLKADFTSNFSDVNKGDYYYEYLGIAKQLGLVNGMEDNAFNPKEDITREDLMLLCSRALKLAGKDVQGSAADLSKFADSAQIAPYAAEGVASLVKQGIVEGNGNGINPLGTATRAETAVIIYRMLNMK